MSDERVERALQRREPEAVVDQLAPALLDPALVAAEFAFQRDVLEFLVGSDKHHRAGRLVDLTALDADEPVLDDVEAADTLRAGAAVQFLDRLEDA